MQNRNRRCGLPRGIDTTDSWEQAWQRAKGTREVAGTWESHIRVAPRLQLRPFSSLLCVTNRLPRKLHQVWGARTQGWILQPPHHLLHHKFQKPLGFWVPPISKAPSSHSDLKSFHILYPITWLGIPSPSWSYSDSRLKGNSSQPGRAQGSHAHLKGCCVLPQAQGSV